MKVQQRIAGVVLIALFVAGSILTAGSWLASMIGDRVQADGQTDGQTDVQTGQLPSAGDFTIDHPIIGEVALEWSAVGTLDSTLTAPTQEELDELPDLGTLDLSFLLANQNGNNVRGYVELEASLAFTGYHTIDTTVLDEATTLIVGPEVTGSYANGVLNLTSERFAYTTESGEAVERQFRLTGSPSQSPGILVGEYRETIWGIGLSPYTVVGSFALKDLNITLSSANRPPVAESLALSTLVNTAVNVALNAADPEGGSLTYAIVQQPSSGSLSGNAPNLTYTPNADFTGTDSFTFKANDGELDSTVEAVTITVTGDNPDDDPDDTPGNSTPVANTQTVNVTVGKATAITLGGTDGDGDSLTYIIVTQPAHGTLSGNAPNLTYTPNDGFVGTDSFTYKVNDGTVDSSTVTVNIVVEETAPTQEESTIFLPIAVD